MTSVKVKIERGRYLKINAIIKSVKIKLFIFILLIIPLFVSAQVKETEKQKTTIKHENGISSLQKNIDELEKKVAYLQQVMQTSFEGVSANLSSSSNYLTIVAIGIAGVAIFIGIYVTRIERKIVRISEESKKLLETHKTVKKEIDDLNELISKNLMGLYSKLREEETKYLVSRLEKVPQDISNLNDLFLSRELSKEYYPIFKKGFLRIKKDKDRYKYEDPYLINLFQHFADLAIFDPEISESLEPYYGVLFESSFENDVLKSTEDFIRMCVDKNLKEHRDKINKYLIAVNNSRYVEFEKLYKVIYDKLIIKENRFLFYELINKELEKVKYMYGKLLKGGYEKDTNTESQKLILKETEELIINREQKSKQ